MINFTFHVSEPGFSKAGLVLCAKEVGSSQKVYYLAELATRPSQSNPALRRGWSRRGPQRRSSFTDGRVNRVLDTTLTFRKRVYDQQMYSSYIGSNRFSKYRNVTPESFHTDSTLIPKAKAWIRRELAVFDFLRPTSPAFGRLDRRATNAEYLLEYIVAILKSIDIKGSAGQATELLKEFLGSENARLFFHELENWLRSPFQDLKAWDQFVQYTAR
ncbi:hypothetical protein LTR05_007600 [Lithohypha guttulata]|uniref:RING-type E3 ubiquitin transferase n=1 Tax=Lithohypha guttulata TaxID=1690604 RepID=A0AAN7SVA9_9EURO|nr:hypothetical protein LTR05_007600 [Lithohypha guttulata]